MEKLKISTVLAKDVSIKPVKLPTATVQQEVTKTRGQQDEILKFKMVDHESLKRVIKF
ncbi:hypothetical protein [Flavobacterium sp. 3HN19-14]|uniref:hypothetical protein n=1 Tax=Flavobacterium sp. 3HN19-14 TaxID=3448133 RepID=UPI003EE38CB4